MRRLKRNGNGNGKPLTLTRNGNGNGGIPKPAVESRWRKRASKVLEANRREGKDDTPRPGGRPHLYETSEELWAACIEYFNWIEATPFTERKWKKVSRDGTGARGAFDAEETTEETAPKMNAMTLAGLQMFLDMSDVTWLNYRGRSDAFFSVCKAAEQIIWDQKFKGAAAGLLNPIIIARQLGLAEKADFNVGTGPGQKVPFQFNILPPSSPAVTASPGPDDKGGEVG